MDQAEQLFQEYVKTRPEVQKLDQQIEKAERRLANLKAKRKAEEEKSRSDFFAGFKAATSMQNNSEPIEEVETETVDQVDLPNAEPHQINPDPEETDDEEYEDEEEEEESSPDPAVDRNLIPEISRRDVIDPTAPCSITKKKYIDYEPCTSEMLVRDTIGFTEPDMDGNMGLTWLGRVKRGIKVNQAFFDGFNAICKYMANSHNSKALVERVFSEMRVNPELGFAHLFKMQRIIHDITDGYMELFFLTEYNEDDTVDLENLWCGIKSIKKIPPSIAKTQECKESLVFHQTKERLAENFKG